MNKRIMKLKKKWFVCCFDYEYEQIMNREDGRYIWKVIEFQKLLDASRDFYEMESILKES